MIQSISFQNFKNYVEASLLFSPQNVSPISVLMGANASGKTNAIEAIRLIKWLAERNSIENLHEHVFIRGNIVDMFQNGATEICLKVQLSETTTTSLITLSIIIAKQGDRLIIKDESLTEDGIKVPLYAIKSTPITQSDQVNVAYNNNSKGGKKPLIIASNRFAIFTQLDSPAKFNEVTEATKKVASCCKRVQEELKRIVFLEPQPSLMRSYAPLTEGNQLAPNGSNVSAVAKHICDSVPVGRTNLLSFIKSIPEQDITDIDYIVTERNDVMIRLHESFGNKERTVDAPLLSDGTLRILSIGCLLLSAPPHSLVIIEEIDNGVHPSRIKSMLEDITNLAQQNNIQVLLTTHNPALLNTLPVKSIPHVLLCFREPSSGLGKVLPLCEYPDYCSIIIQDSLGNLVTLGKLEPAKQLSEQQPMSIDQFCAMLDNIN